MPASSGVRAHVDDLSGAVTIEEPPDSPILLREGVDNGEPGGFYLLEGGVDVVDENRHIRIDGCRGIEGRDAELVSVVVTECGDPAVVHEDGHAEDPGMLIDDLVELFAVSDGEVRYDAIDLHGSSQARTVLTARRLRSPFLDVDGSTFFNSVEFRFAV